MDRLSFISSLVHWLAWPATALLAIALLKRPLSAALVTLGERMRSVSAGGVAITFGDGIDALESHLAAAPAPRSLAVEPPMPDELAGLPPGYGVAQAWAQLEAAIRARLPASGAVPSAQLAQRARAEGLLSEAQAQAAERLLGLRNLAAHAPDPGISRTDALRYRDICRRLAAAVTAETPAPPEAAARA